MKEIQATIYKEYKETRVFTFVFFLLGVFFPLAVYFLGSFSHGFWRSFEKQLGTVSYGGLLAVWLNVLYLSSCAFTREYENKTFDLLRRITGDWRLVAVGKFAYAALASACLALFFVGESFIFDAIFQNNLGTTLNQTFEWTATPELFSSFLLVGLVEIFVWGAFWTARCRLQTTALFATFLTSFFFAYLSISLTRHIPVVGFGGVPSMTLARVLILLVLLPFIPGRRRFGFLEKTTDIKNEQEPNQSAEQIADKWNDVQLKQPSSFGALLLFVAENASLLGHGIPALVVEFVIFMVATVMLFSNPFALPFVPCYFAVFTSSMFRTSKKHELDALSRFNVSPFSYWLANIVVYGVCCLTLLSVVIGLLQVLFTGLHFNSEFVLNLLNLVCSSCIMCAPLLFFSAAEPGSRLVVWGRSIIYLILCLTIRVYYNLDLWDVVVNYRYRLWSLISCFGCVVVALSFFTGSYFLVRNRMQRRQSKSPWIVTWSVVFAMCLVVVIARQNIDLEYESWDDGDVYENRDDTTLHYGSPLYNEEQDIRGKATLTQRLATGSNAEAEAEANFYTKALGLNVEQTQRYDSENTLKFLETIPSLRPDDKKYAGNFLYYVRYGSFDDPYYLSYKEKLLDLRKRFPDEWERAARRQYEQTPKTLEKRRAVLDLIAKEETIDLSNVSESNVQEILGQLLENSAGRLLSANELTRNLLIYSVAAEVFHQRNSRLPDSFQEIRDAGVLSSDDRPSFVQFEPLYSARCDEYVAKEINDEEASPGYSLKLPESWNLDLETLCVVQFVSTTEVVKDPEFVTLKKDGTLYSTRPIAAIVASDVKLIDDPNASVYLIVQPIRVKSDVVP